MQDSTYLITAVVGLLLLYLLQLWVKYRNFPPGPWGVPFLGYVPFLSKDMLTTFDTFKKKYGDICSVNLGSRMVVVLNSYDLMKDVYIKQGDKVTGYLQGFSIGAFVSGEGNNVFVAEGENWKEQKRFLMSNLRDFGFGKMKMESDIHTEIEYFLHLLRDLDGQPCDLLKTRMLARMTCNVISTIVFGRRFDYEDSRLNGLINDIDDCLKAFTQSTGVEVFPILRYFPDRISGLEPIRRCKNSLFRFLREMVLEHEDSYDPENMRDMIDVYLKANKEIVKTNGKEVAPYTMDHLLGNMLALFMAGTDDTVSFITWMIMLAAQNPRCQKKMQEDLDKSIGRQRLTSWMDKSKLVYYEAFALEVLRFGAPLPFSMMHSTYEDITVAGYRIPARTHIMSSIWIVNNDLKIWGDPKIFRPERFIDSEGKINRMRQYVMGFGMGKRTCIGEPLANMEVFLFFTSILQNFDLTLPPGTKTNSFASQPDLRRLDTCNVSAVPRD